MDSIKIKAPGRIVFAGEHQDYLGFPTIPAAINKYIFINAKKMDLSLHRPFFQIEMPDLDEKTRITVPTQDKLIEYKKKREYLKSCVNVAYREGARWSESWKVNINGSIPINAGASSSSAFVIAFLKFLFTVSYGKKDNDITPNKLASLGFEAEVKEFNEAGGQQDHFASSKGKIQYTESNPDFKSRYLMNSMNSLKTMGGFVLANSGVKKSTLEDLKNVKVKAFKAFDSMKETYSNFDRFKTTLDEIQQYLPSLNQENKKVLEGHLKNRDLTQEMLKFLSNKESITELSDKKIFGNLLLSQHEILSKNVGVSIPKIDKMLEIATEAGSFGGKINGSGFGGCMFAYAPDHEKDIIGALEEEGFDSWKIKITPGARFF